MTAITSHRKGAEVVLPNLERLPFLKREGCSRLAGLNSGPGTNTAGRRKRRRRKSPGHGGRKKRGILAPRLLVDKSLAVGLGGGRFSQPPSPQEGKRQPVAASLSLCNYRAEMQRDDGSPPHPPCKGSPISWGELKENQQLPSPSRPRRLGEEGSLRNGWGGKVRKKKRRKKQGVRCRLHLCAQGREPPPRPPHSAFAFAVGNLASILGRKRETEPSRGGICFPKLFTKSTFN